ncbi:PH and SEC7 domain-containing protein isoform X6 [Diprion similis]|uniref:PH and SEC7 domain-containing protein isoform X6 n=1 Tax=Diprion similis TaxID=362088 RepID=UPI001EF7876C|nr:PH and SEC7 domain-containing protein isoform X6 [Diprion similis]
MAEELLVTLNRSDTSGFGFSLLGTAGLPHIVYDIVENSPAAESGKVEAGDVILRVNEVDVNRFSTKEVLKCLRLSSDPVTLKLRRDPAIKARVRRLLSPGHPACEEFDVSRTTFDTNSQEKSSSNHEGKDHRKPGTPELAVGPPQAPTGSYYATRTNGSYSDASCSSELEALLPQVDSFKEEERAQWEPLSADKFNRQKNPPRFEAYMMTGDLMLNLSRTQQSTGLLPKYQKKVDSLRFPLPTATAGAPSGPVGDGTPTGSGVGSISGAGGYFHPTNGDLSQSEAISNMSSPDYNDEETMDILSARDIMMVSDPSDSDSTILASEPPQRRLQNPGYGTNQDSTEHRIVIQVKGPDKETTGNRNNSLRQPRRRGNTSTSNASELVPPSQNTQRFQSTVSSGNVTPEFVGYQELKESEDEKEVATVGDYEEQQHIVKGSSPPQSADEESDIESLHSFHYSPKAVDLPSAVRLAKRLYSLDGFKKSDVSRHLSKNNDFSRAVAEEYLRYFNFEQDTLDVALRKFLAQFSLTGETQERERVLVHFSKRFLDCNPGTFNSQDAVHTLTCAIMLLNTDLHGQNIGRKMSCSEFIENLSELNDGDNFPREVLKQLYNAIKSFPLEWALDDEGDDAASQIMQQGDGPTLSGTGNPFLDVPNVTGATEFKKGYVMRKCCYDANGKKTPFGKRGWKMYYCTLRELVLYLHKDEHSFRSDSLHNAIRIHHALATKAADYTKKQHVFRLQTADQAEYLFQTSDSKELQSWIDTINFVCASFSCQPLAGAVGSQRKFQRPLLPCSHTKLSPREQLRDHEEIVSRLEAELDEHRRHPPERNSKALTVQNYKEKDVYLHYELKRYKTYAYLLRSRLAFTDVEPSLVESSIGEVDEGTGNLANTDIALVPPPVPDRLPTNRFCGAWCCLWGRTQVPLSRLP